MPLTQSDPWPAGTTGVVRLEAHDPRGRTLPLSAPAMTLAGSPPGGWNVRVRLLADLWDFQAEDEVMIGRAAFTPD